MKAVRAGHPAAIALPPCGCSCHRLAPAQAIHCECNRPQSGEVLAVVDTCPTCLGTNQGQEFPGFDYGGPITPCSKCGRSGEAVSGYVTVEHVPIVGPGQPCDADRFIYCNFDPSDAVALMERTEAGGGYYTNRVFGLPGAVPGGVVVTFEPLTVYVETGEFRYGDYKPCVFRNYARSTRFSRFRYWDGRDLHDLPAIGAPIDVTWTEVVPGFEIGEVQ